jgi:hypothetical protein
MRVSCLTMDTTQSHDHRVSWQYLIDVLYFPAPLTTRAKVVQGVRPVPWALPPSTPVRSLPRDADANADAMRYSGIWRAHSKAVPSTKHSKHSKRDHARLQSRQRDDSDMGHRLGFKPESQPISVAPKYRQQLANMARHARLPKPSKVKVTPME